MAATRRVRHSSSQARMLRSGGWSSTRAGIARKRSAAGMLPSCSPASLAKFHSSMPCERVAVEAAERHARAA